MVCDLCMKDLTDLDWYDAKTIFGPWANLCPTCFKAHGIGLGAGLGQHYDADGKKIASP